MAPLEGYSVTDTERGLFASGCHTGFAPEMHTAVRDNFSLITMKTIASLVLATLTLSAAPSTQAHDHCGKKIIIQSCTPHYCASRYVICTKELYRQIEWRC